MRRFSERNPATVGAVGLAVLGALALAAFHPGLATADTGYSAAFREAAGVQPGAAVRVAGVRVGAVTGVALDGTHVRIDFRVERGVVLGSRTAASIRLETVLGRRYLALAPDGTGRLPDGGQIPLARTASPYDVAEAVSGLAHTAETTDTAQLAKAFDALSDTFADTPEAVRGSLRGLSRLSATIAGRDAALRQLLARSRAVTTVLADRDAEFSRLLADGNLLLAEVTARKDAIGRLLASASELGTQLSALIRENRAQLAPALAGLRRVVSVLQRNQRQLEEGIRLLGPYVQAFTNALGNGRWLDTYISGLGSVGSAR